MHTYECTEDSSNEILQPRFSKVKALLESYVSVDSGPVLGVVASEIPLFLSRTWLGPPLGVSITGLMLLSSLFRDGGVCTLVLFQASGVNSGIVLRDPFFLALTGLTALVAHMLFW